MKYTTMMRFYCACEKELILAEEFPLVSILNLERGTAETGRQSKNSTPALEVQDKQPVKQKFWFRRVNSRQARSSKN
jgi:hypothetical protein